MSEATIPISPQPRTPREIIDTAVRENRFGEFLLYGLAALCAAAGVSTLIWAVIHGQAVIAISSSIASALFWPALNSARQTRKESIAMRLLEVPLSRAETAQQALGLVSAFFDRLMVGSGESPKDKQGRQQKTQSKGAGGR